MTNSIIESDLKEYLDRFEQKFDKLESKLDSLSQDFNRKVDKIDERLNKLEVGQARLEEKVDGLGKRLENQEFVSRGVSIALIVAISEGFAKLFGLVGNP